MISLVCASHRGKYKLPKLINSIKKLKHKPNEIIICVTDKNDISKINYSTIKNLNIKIIVSKISNQVYQRHLALMKSKNKIITQVDDDIQFIGEPFFFINKICNNNKNKVLGFYAVDQEQNKNLYNYWDKIYREKKFYFYFIKFLSHKFKIKNMSILKSGRVNPYINFNSKYQINNLEFLNSCFSYNRELIHKFNNKNLMKSQKAIVYEDIFTTYNLYKLGYDLCIDRRVKLSHPTISKKINLSKYINRIIKINEFRKKYNFSLFYFMIDFLLISPVYFYIRYYVRKK